MSVNIPSARLVVPFGRILTGGLITIALAVIANLVALFIMKAILPISPELPPMTALPVIMLIVFHFVAGLICIYVLPRFARPEMRWV